MTKSMCVWLACAGVAMAEVHPRLWFPVEREGEVKQRIADDPLAKDLQDYVVKRAEMVLKERTCEYRIPDGKRLLSESRSALHHDPPPDFVGAEELATAAEEAVLFLVDLVSLGDLAVGAEFAPKVGGGHPDLELESLRRVVAEAEVDVVVKDRAAGAEGHAAVLVRKGIEAMCTPLRHR